MKFLPIVALLLGLTACSSTGDKPVLSSEPISVNTTSDYWVSDNTTQPFNTLRPSVLKRVVDHDIVVKVKYLIDSNGHVYNVEIFESNVDTSVNSLVVTALENMAYTPSESNVSRQPVYAFSQLTFSVDR